MAIRANEKGILRPVPEPRFIAMDPKLDSKAKADFLLVFILILSGFFLGLFIGAVLWVL